MYTTCAQLLCGKIFLGFPAAWDIKNKPLCAECYNEMIRQKGIERGKAITDEDMRKAVEEYCEKHFPPQSPPFDNGDVRPFNPPTMG